MGNHIEITADNAKANLEVFSSTLQELAENDRDILAVTSDSRGSGKLVPFAKKYPKQIIEVGIAEQVLVGVAAGLASTGKKTFAVSPACFLAARSFEQIKNDVAYSDNPVKLIGISAGVSYGALGSTHHSLHDYAALRAINNLIIVAPAENFETEQAIRQASQINKPFYLRFGKKPMHFFGMVGSMMFVLGFLAVVAVGVNKLVALLTHVAAPLVTDSPYFYLALLAMVLGTQLFLTGFVGELVARNSSERNNYLIEKEI